MIHPSHTRESCHVHKWVMLHIWMSHGSYTHESCHTHEWLILSCTRMNRVTHMAPRSATQCQTLQHAATHRLMLKTTLTTTHYFTLTLAHCKTLHHAATHCNTRCNTLQHTATHCNTLQHTATHCNTLQHIDSRRARTARAHAPHSWSAATSLLRNTSVWEHTSKSRTCVAVCCSVWQYVTVCCSVLQCGAACKNMLQWMRQHHCYGNVRKQIHF